MDKKEVFKKFIEENDVLVVDKNPSSRSRLLKIMYDLGSKRHMVHTAGSVEEASNLIKEKNIGLILSDYFIAGGSGFDLFKMIREKEPTAKKTCLVLVTSNISQTAVAKAAEEDVDSFIIKPYTIQSIQENLISTIADKISPSVYMRKIEEGKQLIADKEYDKAIEILKEATKLHGKPALALFYIGQAEALKAHLDQAQGSYQQGLAFNNIHYKCLVGLYELFMKEKQYFEAYQVVKKVAKFFPANPDRLSQIIHLAIRTENYQDLQFYYEIYTSLEERDPILTNYIGAGMFIAGKYSLMNYDPSTALQYFDNIAVSCSAEYPKFVRAMISLLVEHDRADEAKKFLIRLKDKNHEHYLVSDFLIASKKEADKNTVVKKGLDVYNRNIRDYSCMAALIEAMEYIGYKDDKLGPIKSEISKLWPDKAVA